MQVEALLNDSVRLTWSTDRSADKYHVFRNGRYLKTIRRSTVRMSYVDRGVENREWYTYRVVAEDSSKRTSKAERSLTYREPLSLTQIGNFVYWENASKYSVRWHPNFGGYEVCNSSPCELSADLDMTYTISNLRSGAADILSYKPSRLRLSSRSGVEILEMGTDHGYSALFVGTAEEAMNVGAALDPNNSSTPRRRPPTIDELDDGREVAWAVWDRTEYSSAQEQSRRQSLEIFGYGVTPSGELDRSDVVAVIWRGEMMTHEQWIERNAERNEWLSANAPVTKNPLSVAWGAFKRLKFWGTSSDSGSGGTGGGDSSDPLDNPLHPQNVLNDPMLDPDGDGVPIFSDNDNDNDGIPVWEDKDDLNPQVGRPNNNNNNNNNNNTSTTTKTETIIVDGQPQTPPESR